MYKKVYLDLSHAKCQTSHVNPAMIKSSIQKRIGIYLLHMMRTRTPICK